ncbi:MAG: CDP-alcohol phosphatidyltransferase family protein [Gammaproteobacteria bacterium]
MSSALTLPNALSLGRLLLTLPLAWALAENRPVVGIPLFALAVASDLLDGRLARARGQTTRLGTLLDHGADACLVVTLSAGAAMLGLLPAALAPLIAFAFVQYVLDSRVIDGAPLKGSRLGRWNGIAYYVAAGGALAARHLGSPPALVGILHVLGWLLVASTLLSIAARLRAIR